MENDKKTIYPIPEEEIITPTGSEVSYDTKESNKEKQEKRDS